MKLIQAKAYFLVSLIFIITTNVWDLSAQTIVNGIITSNSTWTKQNSPYIVTANTLVQEGVVLTVEPGTIVKFNAAVSLQIDGTLMAQGTAREHITFTANSTSPYRGYWNRIHFTGPNVYTNPNNAPPKSYLEYCDLQFGGSLGKGMVLIENVTNHVNNCTISNSSSAGIYLKKSPTRIEKSIISNNTGSGIYHESDPYFDTYIIDNEIANNSSPAIYFADIGAYYQLNITHNNIHSNAGGIYINQEGGSGSCKIHISQNVIQHNTANLATAIYISKGFDIDISCNVITDNYATNGHVIYLQRGWNPYTNKLLNNYISANQAAVGDIIRADFYVSYPTSFELAGNQITSNTANSGAILRLLGASFYYPSFSFNINNNVITQNTAFTTFSLKWFKGTINNNEINNTVSYEIMNENEAGDVAIDAKHNYWNRTTTELNNKVYDWFDNGNLSMGTTKQEILSSQGNGTDQILDLVVIDL